MVHRNLGQCESQSTSAPVPSHLRWFFQAIVDGKLRSAEKQAFFLALRRLAGAQGRLPESLMITENIDVGGGILASGGFADVRCGTYLGHRVAVKTLRVTEKDDMVKIRKVSISAIFSADRRTELFLPAILQRSHPLEHIEPSECVEACWCSGGHGDGKVRSRVRVDGARKHHRVY